MDDLLRIDGMVLTALRRYSARGGVGEAVALLITCVGTANRGKPRDQKAGAVVLRERLKLVRDVEQPQRLDAHEPRPVLGVALAWMREHSGQIQQRLDAVRIGVDLVCSGRRAEHIRPQLIPGHGASALDIQATCESAIEPLALGKCLAQIADGRAGTQRVVRLLVGGQGREKRAKGIHAEEDTFW